jgi:hypothetical protein
MESGSLNLPELSGPHTALMGIFHTCYILLTFNVERHIETPSSDPLKIKIPSKIMRDKPTNTPVTHSVY